MARDRINTGLNCNARQQSVSVETQIFYSAKNPTARKQL
jgi:hypothetical protein